MKPVGRHQMGTEWDGRGERTRTRERREEWGGRTKLNRVNGASEEGNRRDGLVSGREKAWSRRGNFKWRDNGTRGRGGAKLNREKTENRRRDGMWMGRRMMWSGRGGFKWEREVLHSAMHLSYQHPAIPAATSGTKIL